MTRPRILGRRNHDPLAFAGAVQLLTVESRCLEGNPLGDPHVRELAVYLPPGHAPEDLPVLLVLSGFTGRGQAHIETSPWRRGIVAQYDAAIRTGASEPAVLLLPDCFTKLGGSQYLDSSAVGCYQEHVTEELLPLATEELGLCPTRRGVLGKSSGGFGALTLCMQHPSLFRACGSISGDCCFEYLFPGEFLACLRGLVPFEMDPEKFLRAFFEAPNLSGDAHAVINTLAMAACYSPDPNSSLGFALPFDLETGELIDEVWQRWLAHDPLLAAARHVDALRKLEFLHIECGLTDEFHLQWGTRRLVRELARLGVPHVHEEHPGGHFGTDGRYLALIPRMAQALSAR